MFVLISDVLYDFYVYIGDPDDVFIPVSDGGSDDDEETIDKEETIAEKVHILLTCRIVGNIGGEFDLVN